MPQSVGVLQNASDSTKGHTSSVRKASCGEDGRRGGTGGKMGREAGWDAVWPRLSPCLAAVGPTIKC